MNSVQQTLYLAWQQFQAGQFEQAEELFRQILQVEPNHVDALHLLGLICRQKGQTDQAVEYLQAAVRLKPDFAEAHNNLGNALALQGRSAEAVVQYQQTLRLQPDQVHAYVNLGNIYKEQGRLDDALAAYRAALRIKPDHADAYVNLGNVHKDQGRLDEAIASYRTALQFNTNAAHIHSNLIVALQYHPGSSAQAIHEECRRWSQQHAEPLQKFIRPHANLPDLHRKLRIGYVSADFRDHVVGRNILPLVRNHDRDQVEITLYANVNGADTMTEQFRKCADRWCGITGWPDEQVAERIRQDGIDILVDLALHTSGNRLLVFARKPAPVQVTFAGYPGSTGLATIDYRLTDPFLDPPGLFDAFCSEESVRLPDTFWCYDPFDDTVPAGPVPALQQGFVTFGCLNNFSKINDECLVLWAQVLKAAPQSRLLLLAPHGWAREHVLARLEREGLAGSRIEFVDRQSRGDYLRLHHRLDLILDPLPYNGHTTSLDALWMGVPTITLVGKTVVGRGGWSQLCNLGLQELAAETREQFVALAARMASDLPRLQELHATLRPQMEQSPLMDARRFAAHVEQAYRRMWQRWCEQSQMTQAREPGSAACPRPGKESEPDKSSIVQTLEVARSHFQAGRLDQAEQLYRQILDVDPSNVDALNLLGVIAGQTDRVDRAIECLHAALRLKPDFAEAQCNLGIVFVIQRRLLEAITCFRQAVHAKPDYAVAYNNLGNALREQGQLDEAVETLRLALRLQPDFADAHSNLGLALQAQGKWAEAQASFQQGENLKAAGEHFQRGRALKAHGQIAEAIACHERALQLVPDFSNIHNNLLFFLHYREGITLRELAVAHADFERKFGAPLRSTWKPHANVPDPERRLRIGFVSPDLHRHPVGYFLICCLENLDRQHAEAACYSNSADHDELTARIQAAATNWRDTFEWSDESLAERIRDDRIDILFDLAGHTRKNRLLVFARKPAPIQVTWAGYVGTTGLQAMDYILADRYEIPPEAEPHHVERVLRMPHAYVCYEPPDYAPLVSPLPALKNGYVTFASFNNPPKINAAVVEVWARILCRLPSARLVLKYKGMAEPACADRFVQMFAAHGVDPGRLALLGNSPHVDLLQHYNDIDIALDPFPYNGGLTTLEALWMGVPVVTCPGETFAGRHSLTHLSNLGLTQTIARDQDEYVALAVSLAEDLTGLAALRAGLRERMASSPLCNGPQFADDFLQLLRGMWREWCRQQTADQRAADQR
jgi:predicted O-linked N-acetylglucosamine transferase (SPINDLY family)